MIKVPGVSLSCTLWVATTAYLVFGALNLYKLMNPLYGIDVEVIFPPSTTPYAKPLWGTGTTGNSKTKENDAAVVDEEEKIGIRVYLSKEEEFSLNFLDDEEREKLLLLKSDSEKKNDSIEQQTELTSRTSKSVLLWESDSIERAFFDHTNTISNRNNNIEEDDVVGSVSKSFILTTKQHIEDNNGTCSLSESILTPQGNNNNGFVHTAGGSSSSSPTVAEAIGSSSFILKAVELMSSGFKQVLHIMGIKSDDKNVASSKDEGKTNVPIVVKVDENGPIWKSLMTNGTVHLHVLMTRQQTNTNNQHSKLYSSTSTSMERKQVLQMLHRSHSLLMGEVRLVKHDEPQPKKPTRVLIHDVTYLIQKYILHNISPDDIHRPPPWIVLTQSQVDDELKAAEQSQVSLSSNHYLHVEKKKLLEHSNYQKAVSDKKSHVGYPYWKPEVAIKLVADETTYPATVAAQTGLQVVQTSGRQSSYYQQPTYGYLPPLFVDEIGLTSDKYIPLNQTVTDVPLTIVLESLSPQRYRLISHLSSSLESQRSMGFEQSDIDDVRRLVSDTNVTLLGITILASVLHLLFEFLTFKSEVEFWQRNEDLTGLSVRALFVDTVCQIVVLAYLMERESSFLMTIPAGVGILIAMWKCHRAAGFRFVRGGRFGWTIEATRLKNKEEKKDNNDNENDNKGTQKKETKKANDKNKKASEAKNTNGSIASSAKDLSALSLEVDKQAFRSLGIILFPGVAAFALHSLVSHEHSGWYSWLITTASGCVYALGFVLMTPQLFLNYKLKSVAHLPWKVLCYKFLNTFIDDLFAFIIRMPTMARISCFRDDIVFIIYLIQRFIYPVDKTRPVEGASSSSPSSD